MTNAQETFLANLTAQTATALLAKFDNDPAIAFDKSDEAYYAFNECYQFLNPHEYIQHVWRGTGDHQFNYISQCGGCEECIG